MRLLETHSGSMTTAILPPRGPATVASVNSALQRARKTIEQRLPERSQLKTLRALGDERLSAIVEGYMDAMQRGDVDAVVAMLAEDAVWSMPPLASWYAGLRSVRIFLENGPLSGAWRWRRVAVQANGQPAVAAYTWRDDESCFRPFALDVLTLREDRIAQVTAFIVRSDEQVEEGHADYPDHAVDAPKVEAIFGRFGLPDRLAFRLAARSASDTNSRGALRPAESRASTYAGVHLKPGAQPSPRPAQSTTLAPS